MHICIHSVYTYLTLTGLNSCRQLPRNVIWGISTSHVQAQAPIYPSLSTTNGHTQASRSHGRQHTDTNRRDDPNGAYTTRPVAAARPEPLVVDIGEGAGAPARAAVETATTTTTAPPRLARGDR